MSDGWTVIKSLTEMKKFYESILPRLRDVAKQHGYALGVHGSMTRDFDLIAVPWIDEYSDKEILVRAIQKEACGFIMNNYQWESKPHKRIATCFPICFIDKELWQDDRPSLGHIDLSIIEFNDE